jgi:HPr kinase/phosphorylase
MATRSDLPPSLRWHATTIAAGGFAAAIVGASGSGKSDLALRCISQPIVIAGLAPFQLVSDDQTLVVRRRGTLEVSPPPSIAGKIEVRGVGIVSLEHCSQAELRLIVRLTDEQPDRLPDECAFEDVLGLAVARVWLRPFEASAPSKLGLALVRAQADSARPEASDA